MKLDLIASGLEFPEGPIAMKDGSVILVEIKRQCLSRVFGDGRVEVIAKLPGGPNGAAVGPDGAIYVCNNGGFKWNTNTDGLTVPAGSPPWYRGGFIERVDLNTGEATTLYTHCQDRLLKGPNDLVFDRSGGFWFTDPGKLTSDRLDVGSLYYAQPDGRSITRVLGGLISPNGVGLSPDEKTLYVAETITSRVWVLSVDVPGTLNPSGNAWRPGDVLGPLARYQLLDSLAVEAGGNVCVATVVSGGITTFKPSGSIDHFAVPDALTTNICFGGDDMRDAWITASGTGTLYKTRWPRPGLELNFRL